jgi:hypothetical protein
VPGPEAMLRTPDGATTLGTEHLPIPAVPGQVVVPAAPAPPVPPPAPVAAPMSAAPAAPAPPLPPSPADVPPAGPPHLAAPPAGPLVGEQFGPLTVTTPGAGR